MYPDDTIIALATPSGTGAIAIIRLSGKDALPLVSKCFRSVRGKNLLHQKSHRIHLGYLEDGNTILDKVMVSVFKAPHTYTGEDVVEISCHGSGFIQQQIIRLFIRKGCRMASGGEFTLRAFLNGKLDLSQAEAVADLIASDNEAAHQTAMQQMRGGFSTEIKKLREELLQFASLIELELDFSEEDVDFADRDQFRALLARIESLLKGLIDSFALGNVIKNGVPVAIVGNPNVGKSTLLNTLLNEERAIVSEIAGTTRDAIEDEMSIGGIGFRFIDTAGIRETQDSIERIGIQRTFEKIGQARVVLFLLDAPSFMATSGKIRTPSEKTSKSPWPQGTILADVRRMREEHPGKPVILIINKADLLSVAASNQMLKDLHGITTGLGNCQGVLLSAKTGLGVEGLKGILLGLVNTGALRNDEAIITNSRHYDALTKALDEIQKVQEGLNAGLPGDLLSVDIRQALYHLGTITGEITSDDLLANIFSNFCIGK